MEGRQQGESFADTVASNSADTDLLLLGLTAPQDGQIRSQAYNLRRMLQPLPSKQLVSSAEIEDILQTGENGT